MELLMNKLCKQKLIKELKKMRDLSLAARRQRADAIAHTQQVEQQTQEPQKRLIRIIVYER